MKKKLIKHGVFNKTICYVPIVDVFFFFFVLVEFFQHRSIITGSKTALLRCSTLSQTGAKLKILSCMLRFKARRAEFMNPWHQSPPRGNDYGFRAVGDSRQKVGTSFTVSNRNSFRKWDQSSQIGAVELDINANALKLGQMIIQVSVWSKGQEIVFSTVRSKVKVAHALKTQSCDYTFQSGSSEGVASSCKLQVASNMLSEFPTWKGHSGSDEPGTVIFRKRKINLDE